MAVNFRTNYRVGRNVFWRGEAKVLPGGFKPAVDYAHGTILRQGSLVNVNFTNRTATVIKYAEVVSGGTTQKPRVKKGHFFTGGETITKVGDGKASPKVSSVDTSNTEYDVLNLSAAYTGLAAGDFIVESTDFSSSIDAVEKYEPNAVVAADIIVDATKGIPTIDAAYEANVILDLSYNVPSQWLSGGIALRANHSVKFIKQ